MGIRARVAGFYYAELSKLDLWDQEWTDDQGTQA